MTEWTGHAARLAKEPTEAGKLWSTPWQAAVRAVPRHELVPVHYEREPGTGEWIRSDAKDDLDLVYSNTALFVMPDGLSSTSMPALMTRMLETLDVHDGHDVLEIGAGTGYNAALLSHRLGDQHVFAVDIEPTLIRLARERLARMGYHPTLIAADGVNGLAEHAPYDRIIATCSVPAVPWAWVEQTRDGGLILADVKPGELAGNLVLLRKTRDGAEGRFDHTYGSFMAMRRGGETYSSPRPGLTRDRTTARSRRSTLNVIRPWEHSVLWFSPISIYLAESPSGYAARTPADHPLRRFCPQPTAPGARSTNHPLMAHTRSGKQGLTNCGASSKTPTPPG